MASRFAFISSVVFAFVLTASVGGCSGGSTQNGAGGLLPASREQPIAGAVPLTLGDLTDAAASSTPSWPQPGLNAAHTAFDKNETALTTSNVNSLTQQWSFATGGEISEPIVVNNGIAYVDSGDGYLYALNTATGALLWKYQVYVGNGWADEPVIGDGKVFVACEVGGYTQQDGLCALNAATGKRAWDYYIDCNCLPNAGISTAPVVSGSTIVFGYGRGGSGTNAYVTALSAKSGALLWAASTGGQQFSNNAPAIASGNVYVGISNGLGEYALSTGAVVRGYATGDGTNMAAVADGTLYVNTFSRGYLRSTRQPDRKFGSTRPPVTTMGATTTRRLSQMARSS